MVTIDKLIDFETRIGNLFNAGKIAAPIHLYSGNEELIIEELSYMNMNLHKIWKCGQTMKLCMLWLGVIILAKPMK